MKKTDCECETMTETLVEILEVLVSKFPEYIKRDLQEIKNLTTKRIEYVDKVASSLNKIIILRKQIYMLKQIENQQQPDNIMSDKDRAIMENYLRSQLRHLQSKMVNNE